MAATQSWQRRRSEACSAVMLRLLSCRGQTCLQTRARSSIEARGPVAALRSRPDCAAAGGSGVRRRCLAMAQRRKGEAGRRGSEAARRSEHARTWVLKYPSACSLAASACAWRAARWRTTAERRLGPAGKATREAREGTGQALRPRARVRTRRGMLKGGRAQRGRC